MSEPKEYPVKYVSPSDMSDRYDANKVKVIPFEFTNEWLKLKREADKLREALAFYAQTESWVHQEHPDHKFKYRAIIYVNDVEDVPVGPVLVPTGGKLAREAIAAYDQAMEKQKCE